MKNFYLLYGLDKSIITNETNTIIKKLNITDIIKYSQDNIDINTVIEDASTISMFDSKKIIILEDCNFLKANKSIDNLELLEKYLNNYNKDTYMILICNTDKLDTRKKIYKELSKVATITNCQKTDITYQVNYVKNYLENESYQIEDINYFLKVAGTNLNNIKNELDKLIMYKLDDKNIKNSDIDKITVRNIENEIFDLTDAVILGDTKKAMSLLEEFLNKNYDEIQIIMLLASQFRFIFQVKRLVNKNKRYDEIAKILEVNPYRVKFTIKKIYTYSEYDILNNIKKLAKIDHDIKFGIMNKKLALELFILNKNQI